MRTHFVVLIALALTALSACMENTTQPPASAEALAGKTDVEKKLEAEARSLNQISGDIIAKNTIEGVALGAVAGCGIGFLTGGDGKDCARGAVVGGAVGGVTGNVIGRQAAAKNEEIVKGAEIVKNLSNVSTRLNSVERNLRMVLSSQNAELRSLRRQMEAKQVSQSAYNSRVRAINSNRTNVRNALIAAEKNVVEARADIADARKQGQDGLGQVDEAAVSTKTRLARTRSSISLIEG